MLAFDTDTKVYNKWHTSMEKMRNLITTTTNTQYHAFFQDLGVNTLWSQLKALKNNLEPSVKLHVEAAYEMALRPNKRTSITTWLNNFRCAYNDAKRIDLPIVRGHRAHFHFIDAVEIWDFAWAQLQMILVNDSNDQDKPSVNELITSFTRWREIKDAQRELDRVLSGSRASALSVSTTTVDKSLKHQKDWNNSNPAKRRFIRRKGQLSSARSKRMHARAQATFRAKS
jgi:hypothetical protein